MTDNKSSALRSPERRLTKERAFIEVGQEKYEERYRQREAHNFVRRAREMGFELKPKELRPA